MIYIYISLDSNDGVDIQHHIYSSDMLSISTPSLQPPLVRSPAEGRDPAEARWVFFPAPAVAKTMGEDGEIYGKNDGT